MSKRIHPRSERIRNQQTEDKKTKKKILYVRIYIRTTHEQQTHRVATNKRGKKKQLKNRVSAILSMYPYIYQVYDNK